ncbi:MAG TPA: hypothetical protein VMQ51_07835 [Candidatus Binatia bacterium]|nr:hypothetical protein [Candidatus Binatia bacterium]
MRDDTPRSSRVIRAIVFFLSAVGLVIAAAAGPVQAAPFQFQADLSLAAGEVSTSAAIPVPAGMRLVIETVTADIGMCFFPGGRGPRLHVQTVLDGQLVEHVILLTKTAENPNGCSAWESTRDLRLYTDAAIVSKAGVLEPKVVVARHYGGMQGMVTFAHVTISGRLVPADQE